MTAERMSEHFVKYHHGDGRATHHFTGPDRGGPHDHPCALDITIRSGGYVERVYHVAPHGAWTSEDIARRPGHRFTIAAEHIHEIIALPEGECWTEVQHHPHTRETRFYRFDDRGVASRMWNEAEYTMGEG